MPRKPLSPPLPRAAVLTLAALLLAGGVPVAYAVLDAPARAGAQEPAAVRQADGGRYVETRLFFGTARPDGGPAVTDKEFRVFVTEVVTPRFPDGLTVQEGYGQYRDAHGTIERERSYELILYYPRDHAAATDPEIEEIRRAYTERFAQESVARVDDRARVDF